MNMMLPSVQRPVNHGFIRKLFGAKSARTGGIVRRSKRDVHREIGLDQLIKEVKRRGFHLVESGDQYVIICHPGHIRIVC